mgnify:CR=1 FL=1
MASRLATAERGNYEGVLGTTDRMREPLSRSLRPTRRPWHRAGLRLSRRAEPSQLREIRQQVGGWASRHRLPPDTVLDLQLAVGEAVANGIEHAYRGRRPGTLDIRLNLRPARIQVEVVDHGRWRPIPASPGHRGRGLALIEALAGRVDVKATRSGTRVRFGIPVRPVT